MTTAIQTLINEGLINIKSKNEHPHLSFIVPTGVIYGKFENYQNNIITITNAFYLTVDLQTNLSFPIDIVLGWGKGK